MTCPYRILHEIDGLGRPRFFATGTEIGSLLRIEVPSKVVNDHRGRIVELKTGVWCSLEDGAADVAARLTNLIQATGLAGVISR